MYYMIIVRIWSSKIIQKNAKFCPFFHVKGNFSCERSLQPRFYRCWLLLWEARNDFVPQFLLDCGAYNKTYTISIIIQDLRIPP